LFWANVMVKKATIVVSLVKESAKKTNTEIEKEILQELSKHPVIPWMAKVDEVKVTE